MAGLFACCCGPASQGQAERVSAAPATPAAGPAQASAPGPSPPPEAAVDRRLQQAAPEIQLPKAAGTEGSGGGRAVERGKSPKSSGHPDLEDAAETASVASSRSNLSRSMGTTSSVTSDFIQDRIPARQRETAKIQTEMKAFVRDMVKGRRLGVIAPDGGLRTCACSLDKRLKHFVIELQGSVRRIGLTEITEVYQGKEPEDIETPLDELCSTLLLESGECISFRFDDIASRERFAMCLQILVDGQQ
eukprot:TRINITY_DN16453_c0_g1_i1.p1 TRINITY_DN16453_c0_g1~~TRINITY_DN16453_c0_g1_i1.p1  ORF type:complete len:247 (+),score=54.32 TRINITY_DN16453_c0_g1_i1:133-873(+)